MPEVFFLHTDSCVADRDQIFFPSAVDIVGNIDIPFVSGNAKSVYSIAIKL
mgnify:CR=1 FL=1